MSVLKTFNSSRFSFGPSNGRDIFQFTESTRVLVMDSGFAILDADEVSGFDGKLSSVFEKSYQLCKSINELSDSK